MKFLLARVSALFVFLLSINTIHAQSAGKALTIREALQAARENNPFFKSQRFDVSIAESDVVTANLRPNPVLNNQSLQLLPQTHFAPETRWYSNRNQQTWWQLTRTFQLPSQRNFKIEAAQKNVSVSEKELLESERKLLLDVGIKWLDVWGLQKQLEILQQAKGNVDSLIVINRNRLKNQVITQTDLLRTELLARQYELELKSVFQTYRNELLHLKTITGEKAEISIDSAEHFTNDTDHLMIDSLISRASDTRPDLLSARARISAAEANMKLQRSLAIPQPELGVIYNPQNAVRYLGIFATIELPFSSRNQGEIRKSVLLRSQADQDLQAVGQLVDMEVATALRTYQINKENVGRQGELLASADQILASVRYSYVRGGTTIIDLLEAQRSWLDTKRQYYQILQEYEQSYLRLLHASGAISQLAN